MVTINLRINPAILAGLLDLVSAAVESVLKRGTRHFDVSGGDEDLREALEAEARQQLQEDCRRLIDLMQVNEFGDEAIEIAEHDAESILRAASAIRLRLRETALRAVPDVTLESGEVNMVAMPMDERQAYVCYSFLAQLQSQIVYLLDGGDLPDDLYGEEDDEDFDDEDTIDPEDAASDAELPNT